MSEHTKEPWRFHESIVVMGQNEGGFDIRACPSPEANARRIVACVNACEGVATEDLERLRQLTPMLFSEWLNTPDYVHDRVIEQRDELLAALKGMVEVAEFGLLLFRNTTPPDAYGPLIQARAAIAKAEGA